MPNQSLMAVPVELKTLDDVRILFGRLIVNLDKVLGNRDNNPAVTVNDLKQAPIADTKYSGLTISVSYSQTEVQQVVSDLVTVSNKLDKLLSELRLAGIIGP